MYTWVNHHPPESSCFEIEPRNPWGVEFEPSFFDEIELPLNEMLPRGILIPDDCDAGVSIKREASKLGCVVKMKEKNSQQLAVHPRRKKMGGKKDRHSKIRTAQGVRDRRMRLSLSAARKFFDLQDMLGYDKASKTIEWLFSKSKRAIEEVMMMTSKNPKSESECEDDDVSGVEENSNEYLNFSPCKSETTEEEKKKKKTTPRAKSRSSPNLKDLVIFEEINHCPSTENRFPEVGAIEKLLNVSSSSSNCCPNFFSLSKNPSPGGEANFVGFSSGNWDLRNNDRSFMVTDQDSVFVNPVFSSVFPW